MWAPIARNSKFYQHFSLPFRPREDHEILPQSLRCLLIMHAHCFTGEIDLIGCELRLTMDPRANFSTGSTTSLHIETSLVMLCAVQQNEALAVNSPDQSGMQLLCGKMILAKWHKVPRVRSGRVGRGSITDDGDR